MWAEWMANYDLTVTKEDIEKWEEMRREKDAKNKRRCGFKRA